MHRMRHRMRHKETQYTLDEILKHFWVLVFFLLIMTRWERESSGKTLDTQDMLDTRTTRHSHVTIVFNDERCCREQKACPQIQQGASLKDVFRHLTTGANTSMPFIQSLSWKDTFVWQQCLEIRDSCQDLSLISLVCMSHLSWFTFTLQLNENNNKNSWQSVRGIHEWFFRRKVMARVQDVLTKTIN